MNPVAAVRLDVLVVDDDPVARHVLARSVEREGFRALQLPDALAAQALLEGDDPPSLLLLDWMMPGMSGPDLARWIRGVPRLEGTYICMVTAQTGLEDMIEALAAGADDFLTKPYRASELLARLQAGQRVVRLHHALRQRVGELESALAEVRQLRGLIPICMHCHRIRSESEQWQRLEAYLEAHSDASFSHSICDQCFHEHYPDFQPAPGEE